MYKKRDFLYTMQAMIKENLNTPGALTAGYPRRISRSMNRYNPSTLARAQDVLRRNNEAGVHRYLGTKE